MEIKNNRNWIIHLISTLSTLCFLFFFSCRNDSVFEQEIKIHDEESQTIPYKYLTRNGENGFWENWEYITINNGFEVNTPWNPKAKASAIPPEICNDIKYEDGWDIIFPLTEGDMKELCNRDCPYLIFHNRYTGILKAYSYLQTPYFSTNNGIWQIKTEKKTSLFAFQNTPISKISEPSYASYFVTNLTVNATGGFTQGWNCFQIELAYDPAQSGDMTITTFALNKIDIKLDGNIEADTKGFMTTPKDPSLGDTKSFANVAGNEAKKWIANKIQNKIISSVVSEAVKAVVSGGVGKIIGSLTGLFKKDETVKSFQLTTNGTISIPGQAEFVSTTGIPSITFSIDPQKIGYLGVWGLIDEPTVFFSPYAVLKTPQQHTNGYTSEYRVDMTKRPVASIAVNPKLMNEPCTRKIITEYFEVDAYTQRNVFGNIGVVARNPPYLKKVYNRYYNQNDTNSLEKFGSLYNPNLYMIVDVAFKGDEGQYLSVDQYDAPMEVFIPDVPGGPKGAVSQLQYNSNYIATVGVQLTLPDGSEGHSYHQCKPNFGWNYEEYNNGLYRYMYPCEPVYTINTVFNEQNTKGLDIYSIPLNKQIKTRQK